MPEARKRLAAVTAACAAALVAAVTAGAVLMSSGPTSATPTSAAARVRSGDLPLRIPEVEVTLSAKPHPTPPAPSRARAEARTAAATRAVRARMPSAAERDRELAALVARSATAPAGAAGVLGSATTPTGASSTGTTSTGTTSTGTTSTGTTSTGTGTSSGPAATFTLSSFNVLGASHTRNGGRGRAPGVVRINGVAQLLARHDVDVVGFQELQHEQARALLQVTGGGYTLYPGAAARDSDNSIGWRTSEFELVRATTVSIPYFNGHHRDMPVVLLRHRASGVEAWFGNFHNPADTHRFHHQQGWRTQATYVESALANRTAATGVPLFITGDMNERADYFCRLTTAASMMVAARGGSNGAGGCSAGRPRAVDWIFGTRGVGFSGYSEDRTPLVHQTTDHPVIATRVSVDPAVFPRSVS